MADQEKEEKVKGVTIQHIGKLRQWTIPREQVLKSHNGRTSVVDENHPRFKHNIVLLPGCIIDVVPSTAKMLIESLDFQKYGVK